MQVHTPITHTGTQVCSQVTNKTHSCRYTHQQYTHAHRHAVKLLTYCFWRTRYFYIFTTWHYASAVYSMALYLCLSVSVRSRAITKMAERIQLVFLWEPPPTYATLRKFGYFQNNGIFYWKSVPNSGLRKFFLHMKFANFNKAHRRLSFLVSPTMVGASWLFITRQSAVTFKFQHFDLLYNLFMQQLTRFQLTALCAVHLQ